MVKILGLDLGTNSIGWAIVEKDQAEFTLIDKGARIFSEGVKIENGIESSRAAERTGYRSARRIKYRRKLRKYETLKVLAKNDMCPLTVEEVKNWKKSGFKEYPLNPDFLKWLRTDDAENINPYFFRDKASKIKVTPFEFGRALYHITQRRGFLSNRLDQSAEGVLEEHCPRIQDLIEEFDSINEIETELNDYFTDLGILDKNIKGGFKKDLDDGEKKLKGLFSALNIIVKNNIQNPDKCKEEMLERLNKKENLGVVKQKISELTRVMKENDFMTLGQYFYSLYNKDKIRNQYTAREEHYLNEFEIICRTQAVNGILDDVEIAEKRYFGLVKDLYKAIFFQRPLKSQKGLIGKCSFEPTKARCATSHPLFEEYRMWSFLNTIKYTSRDNNNLRFLTQEEKEKLIPKFLRKSKVQFNFEELVKELIPKGTSYGFYKSSLKDNFDYLFNYRSKDTVSGCPVSASLKMLIGDNWQERTFSYTTTNTSGAVVNRNVDYLDLWHLLSVSTSDAYLFEYAKNKLLLDEKRAKTFSKIRIKNDYGNLSLSAISKILPYLKEGLLYSHAVFMANLGQIVDEKIWNDSNRRSYIKNGIAQVIDYHVFENNLLGIVNGLIKTCKLEGTYYSKEAEHIYKSDLENKLSSFFRNSKIEDEQSKSSIFENMFSIFIEQLKKFEFVKIKRLDEKVLDFLKGQNEDGEVFCNAPSLLKKIYHPSDIDVFKKEIVKDEFGNETYVLGSPLTQSIKNPMAMRALHQLRKVLNTLILEGQIDEKTRIHIEMARELNDANKRNAIQDYQNEIKKNREAAQKEIRKLYFEETKLDIEPTGDDLLRYQLWIEQNRKEIYEGGNNIPISAIIGKNPKYDIEHTIPRSISQDNSQMNKTLCSPRFNREIKKQQMPVELNNYEEIKLRVKHWRIEAEKLEDQIQQTTRYIKNASTKEIKDKNIRRRHYLSLKRDYIKGKYDRFIWTEPRVGFKNSQIPDTGIITRYAQAYLKSYFQRVDSVKGGMVAEFRKIWGIQESFQKDGKKYFKEKDRSSHTHHTIDAITIACMTKDKYDVLAQAWTLEDKENITAARNLLADSKPWKTFKEDLRKIESEILISHYTPDNVRKQSKKIMRIRGLKQYVAEIERASDGKVSLKRDGQNRIIYKRDKNGDKIPRFKQGDTVRGSLHQDSIYGAIKNPLNLEEIKYVIRKDLESLKTTEIESIVDETVKIKVKQAIVEGVIILSSNPNQKNKVVGIIWMNEEKKIPIKKVRIFAKTVKNPLEIKQHSKLSRSKHKHKKFVYGQNDENYAMAIYEGIDKKGKLKRDFETINNMIAGDYFKLSNSENNEPLNIIPDNHFETGRPLKYILKKGQMVIFYNNEEDELLDLQSVDLSNRLYQLTKFDAQGRLTFRRHNSAKPISELKEVYSYDFEKPDELIRLQVSKLNFFVEYVDFRISASGKVVKI